MTATERTSALARAREGWGDPLPTWVRALAEACDRTSQAKAGDAIGYSGPLVNQVLGGRYKGNLGRVERAVRGAFLSETVTCPGQHRDIPTNECAAWQRKPYDGANHLHVLMFRACQDCPERAVKEDSDAE